MLTPQSQETLKVRFGGHSATGPKSENQDAFSALKPKGNIRHLKGVTACLADGVSCSENAQQASQMAVSQFIDDYYATPDTWPVKSAASKILSSLNNWLFHHGQQSSARHNGFVTTFTSLIIKSTTAHIFHVGDSRLYRYRKNDDRLQLLTRDHVQQHNGKNILTRALGIDSHLEIDYHTHTVQTGDIYILTSDGTHEFVSPTEIRQAIEAGDDLEITAKHIVEHALNSGSDDNTTCLLVAVDHLPQATLEEAHRELTRLAIPPVMDIGMKLDGYEVKKILYSGTRSHLYLVQHPEHNRPYVLKAPSQNFTDDTQYLEGFIREQWIGLRINSDNVMKVYPSPHNSQFLYLLMEFIEGQTLRQWMHDHPKPSLESARKMIEGVIAGMRVLNRMEMVHRDIKPENIMVANDGNIKIIDFGTVKVNGLTEITSPTSEDIPVGSVDYIAPEYLLYQQCDQAADLFSLGVMTYELLCGKLPYHMSHTHRRQPKALSEWKYQSIRQHRNDIPAWIDYALKKATAPSIQKRYSSLSELMTDLCKPNSQFVEEAQAPLLERNPVLVWQGLSLTLAVIIIVQWVFLLK